MTEVEEILNHSADLVKSWGKIKLARGKTLGESLTIGEVPFWDVVSPSLAVSSVASALEQSGNVDLMRYSSLFAGIGKRTMLDVSLPVLADSKACIQWPENPAFLFLGFSHYMFRETLSPVAKNISARKNYAAVVLNDSLLTRNANAGNGAPVVNSIWQHWNSLVAEESRSLRKDLRIAITEIKAEGVLKEILRDSDRPLYPILANTFSWLFNAFLPRMVNHLAIAKHILSVHNPKLIISPDVNDPRIRIYMHLAKKMGIPSLEVQLCYAIKARVEWQFFLADSLAVNGEYSRRIMLSHGIPPEKITVTGSPRYDGVCSCKPQDIQSKRSELKVTENSVMLVFGSQPYVYGSFSSQEIRIEMIKVLFKTVAGIDNLILMVKPHPLENTAELKKLAGHTSNIVFAEKNSDIRELIALSDAFVTFFSTTAFDSFSMAKPTILMSFPNSNHCPIFEDSGAALVAKSEDDIHSHLQTIMNGIPLAHAEKMQSARNQFLENWLYKLDGGAASRIEALAFKISGLSKRPGESR